MGCCHHYQFSAGGDDLFTVDVNRIRFGPGALRELGAEVAMEGVKNAAVFIDSVVAQFERASLPTNTHVRLNLYMTCR